jgi:YidC/Oxa1 family membrane protein insertase
MILANVIQSAFSPLIWVFLQILLGVHAVVGGSWGWAIIGLTLIVRTLTFPLTRSQFKGMAKMRLHAPELKKIQEKYKDDRVRQQEETMKYYKEVGFNPLSACLPLLLQFPVFISLVYMLRTDLPNHICSAAKAANVVCKSTLPKGSATLAAYDHVVAKHAGFLFVSNITTKATGVVLIVLMALYVGTQAFTGAMMSVGNSRNQRLMSIGLPFVFVLFVIQFAAGLLVYWIATNVTMIPQQIYMLRKYGRPSGVPVTVEGGGGGSAGGSGGSRAAPKAGPSSGGGSSNGKGSAKDAAQAVRKPAATPPAVRQRQRKKRSGRRR